MPIYRKKINGRLVWRVRVVHKGLNASRICATKPEAREVEPVLLVELKRKAAAAEQSGLAPATVKGLFEAYVADLEARGKGPDTIGGPHRQRSPSRPCSPSCSARRWAA